MYTVSAVDVNYKYHGLFLFLTVQVKYHKFAVYVPIVCYGHSQVPSQYIIEQELKRHGSSTKCPI